MTSVFGSTNSTYALQVGLSKILMRDAVLSEKYYSEVKFIRLDKMVDGFQIGPFFLQNVRLLFF